MGNRDEIVRFLRILFAAGDVFEVRVLDAVTPDYQRPHAESGYFDYEHIPRAADSILALRSYAGVYATLNPVNHALLARACNRLAPAKRDNSTADGDILVRRWLPVDCDPVRPAGISSTDEEHASAHALAKTIREGLSSIGWPEPVVLDSGNGAQMLYRIDLPTGDADAVRNAITGIAAASIEEAKVDLSVFNAARIWRIPGTMNRKGDSIPERPHRMASIVSVPEAIVPVAAELIAKAAPPKQETTASHPSAESFDADRWIAAHCPELGDPVPWQGGRKWVFRVCPFNPEHDNSSAVLIQAASGAMAFKCHHNGCAGNDWRKLREMREPGCYAAKELPNIDLEHLTCKDRPVTAAKPVKPQKKSEHGWVDEYPNPGELPERLLHISGIVDDFVEWSMSSAPHPNRVLEFCGAIAFLSYIVGRKVTSDRGTMPNLYLIALADSGTGKDHPRKVNTAAAIACGVGAGVIEDVTSGAAVEDMLFLNPTVLLQKDEIDTLFNTMKMAKDPNSEGLLGKLLTIYSSSGTVFPLRQKALGRGELMKMKSDMANGLASAVPLVSNPYLTIFGTAIPQFFYESLSPRILGNGMGARCILLDAGRRGPPNRPKLITMPESLKRSFETISHYGEGGGNLNGVNPTMLTLGATPEADELLDSIAVKLDGKYHSYDETREQTPRSFWARANEKVGKLAMLYAISTNPDAPIITEEAVAWAYDFADFTTRQSLYLVSSYSYENPFDEKKQKIMRLLRRRGGECSHAELLHYSHESKEVFTKIMDTLLESEEVVGEDRETGGKRLQRVYRIAVE